MNHVNETAANASRGAERQLLEAELAHLDRLSTLLDTAFRIPGTSIRFGWDSLLGLAPGVGDIVTMGPAIYLIYRGRRMGARRRTLVRMGLNAGIDLLVGAAPVVGDIFDLAFKANKRNVALLRGDLEKRIAST